MIQIFSADGRTGRTGRTGPTKGSTRGPRGPKKKMYHYYLEASLTTIICEICSFGAQGIIWWEFGPYLGRDPLDVFDLARAGIGKACSHPNTKTALRSFQFPIMKILVLRIFNCITIK